MGEGVTGVFDDVTCIYKVHIGHQGIEHAVKAFRLTTLRIRGSG